MSPFPLPFHRSRPSCKEGVELVSSWDGHDSCVDRQHPRQSAKSASLIDRDADL